MIRVFVDTSIARFADREREVWLKQKRTVRWGPTTQEIEIAQPHTLHPLEKIKAHEETHTDALLIEQIEKLARQNLITLMWHFETHWEFVRGKRPGNPPPILELISRANCPIYYGRPLVSPFDKKKDEQLEFLHRLNQPEYEKWKKLIGGALSGSDRERNQLMDAWHLWSAEHNHCEYFLTMDYTLIKSVKSRKSDSLLRLVAPKQFLEEFNLLRSAAEAEKCAWTKIAARTTP